MDKRPKTPKTTDAPAPVNPTVATEGVPGFHPTTGPDGHTMADQQLDTDMRGRVDTGTGDQPGNTHGDRFATPSGDASTDAP